MDTRALDARLRELLAIVDGGFSPERCLETLRAIFASDRRGDYRAFRETAQIVQRGFEAAGLSEVEVIPHPADGVRRHGDWIVPQAWDGDSGELAIVGPASAAGTVVCHPDEPLAMAMYSAPTPPGGIEGELVMWEDVDGATDLTGKLVLTSKRVREIAGAALARGAAGLLSDFAHAHAVDRTARYWENYCFVPRNTTGGFAFILSPEEGERLRSDLHRAQADGERLTLRATVNTRLYDGEVDIVTGVVAGREPGEEVLLVAHLYEIGANDNCSGAALCTEVARCLTELVAGGELPRPRRSIRVLLCFEQYGTIAYLDLNRDRVPDIVAGLNADMVGEDQELCGSELTIDRTPPANPSYTNDLIARLVELQSETCPWFRWRETCYGIHDGFISDPMLDIPTPTLLHQPDRFYHSDADTPDKVSPETLRVLGAAVGAYAYTIADAGAAEAEALARLAHERDSGARAVRSVLRLVPDAEKEGMASVIGELIGESAEDATQPQTPEEERGQGMIPHRLVFGSLTMADLPREAAEGLAELTSDTFPYSTHLCSALFWADGKRTVLEIRDRLAEERGSEDLRFLVRFFEFLEAHGYCRTE